ncbi:MAG: type II secretion system F family protein [Planctomycetes bacterium]|nr:type II secretion system F family protein [Planctomycetota bacterium]
MALRLPAFYRALSQLHSAAVPWPDAVERAGAGDRRVAPAVEALRRGEPLASALDGVLPPLDHAAVHAAEASGRLEPVLAELADRAEAAAAQARERAAQLAYPFVVAHLAALLLPVPNLVMGDTAGAALWAAAVLVPLWGALLVRRAARRALDATPRGSSPPAWTNLLRTRASVEEADARALRALGWLEDAGVPLLEAVPLAAHAGAGGRVAADLTVGWAAVRSGRPLSAAWARTPGVVASALRTGEETGRLAEACRHEALALDGSATLRRAKTTALLKPLAILLIGLVVGARVILFYAGALRSAMR